MKTGDIVVNVKGWQGRIEVITRPHRTSKFGPQCLVQYASRREWESQSALQMVVKAQKEEAD